jgi:HK97 family phage prohead protease
MDPAVPTAEIHYLPVGFAVEEKSVAETKEETGAFGTFRGYGSVFNNLDCDYDVVRPGAFKASLARQTRIKMLWQHRTSEIIGSFTSFQEDEKGLAVEGRINLGTEKGREAYALLKAGDMDGLSIGYRVKDFEVEKTTGVRFLKEVDLMEISLVTMPANQRALVTDVKSVEDVATLSDLEDLLRKSGFSRDAAIVFISRVKSFSGQSQREAGDGEPTHDVKMREASDTELGRIALKVKGITHNLRMQHAGRTRGRHPDRDGSDHRTAHDRGAGEERRAG